VADFAFEKWKYKQDLKMSKRELEDLERKWVLFDADGVVLGRLASRVARILRGKHKPVFTPHMDCGDAAIVINCDNIEITGNKDVQEGLISHSQYPGGLKEKKYEDLLEDDPSQIVRWAVKGMLPKNKLRDRMLKHFKVYNGPDHPHEAQQPVEYDFSEEKILS
jgi:large subunit ribosomal protein L13